MGIRKSYNFVSHNRLRSKLVEVILFLKLFPNQSLSFDKEAYCLLAYNLVKITYSIAPYSITYNITYNLLQGGCLEAGGVE